MMSQTSQQTDDASVDAPQARASRNVTLEELARLRRKRTIALLGLAGSGKTSYLHAMAAAPQPSWLRWVWPPANRNVAAQTGRPGEPLVATSPGVFMVSELDTLYRPWNSLKRLGDLRFLFAPQRRLTIPEVAGEHVRNLADTDASLLSPRDRGVDEKLRAFLDRTDMVLFLAGLKNTARDDDAMLKQDLIEGRIGAAASSLGSIVAHMRRGRGAADPIFVTLLVTKRDLLRAFPGLDWVRLPKERSALLRLSGEQGRASLREMIAESRGGAVRFEFNQVCDRFADDLAVQEAATVDYLACHAPKAYAALVQLAKQRAVSLRILPCKPFGRECKTRDGRSAFPESGQLETALVWEPLDALVERSYCAAARRASGRRWTVAMVLLALAFLTGPLQSWFVNRAIDSRIAAGTPASAATLLEWNESPLNWWPALLRATSADHAYADAARWKGFRDGFEWTPEQRARMDRFIDARDPTHTLAADDAASARADSLIGFIGGRSKDPALVPPVDRGPMSEIPEAEVDRVLPELTDGDGLLLSDADAVRLLEAVRGTWLSPVSDHGTQGWWLVSANLGQLAKWLGFEPGGDRRRVVVRGNPPELLASLRADIEHARACADLRMRAAKENIGDYRAMEVLAREAIALGDGPALAAIDARRDASVAAEWSRWTASDTERWDGAAALAAFVQQLDAAMPADGLVGDLRRREAARRFGRWLRWASESMGVPSRAPDSDGLAAAAHGIEQFMQSMGEGRPSDTPKLVDGLRSLAQRGAVLGRIPAGAELPRDVEREIRDLYAGSTAGGTLGVRLEDGGPSGGAIEFDVAPIASRQTEQLVASLAARRDALMPAIRKGELRRLGEYRRIEELRRSIQPSGVADPPALDRAVVDAVAALGDEPVSGDAVREALLALLSQKGGISQAQSLIESCAGSESRVRQVGASILAAIETAPGLGAGDRQQLAEATLGGIRAWELVPAEQATALLVAGSRLGFDVAALAARESGKVYAGTTFDTDAADRLARWYAVLVACGDEGAAARLFQPLLQRALGDIERGSIMVPGNAEMLLLKLRGRGPREVEQAVDAIKAHRDTIRRWDLVPLPDASGTGIACYIAPREWSVEELRKLDATQRLRIGGVRAFDEAGKPFCEECARPGCGTLLGLAQGDASQIASQAGLRLPTAAEWNAAFRLQVDPAKPIDPVENQIDAAGLKSLGDVARTAPGGEEIVGLRFGVREWCSDGNQPMGGRSCNLPDGNDGKDNVYRGLRPAADAVPSKLRALVTLAK